jgi:hypothetical protein
VRELCRSGKWSKVRVLAPEELRSIAGWIPNRVLRAIKTDSRGHRIYTTWDDNWSDDAKPYRRDVLTAVNAIMRDDERCEAIDDVALVREAGRDSRIEAGCVGPAGTVSIAFTPRDASNGRSFKVSSIEESEPASEPINKANAIMMCEEAVTNQLAQPRSADFHIFTNLNFSTDGARARLTIGLTAKNALGLEVDNTAECLFEGKQLTAANVIPQG